MSAVPFSIANDWDKHPELRISVGWRTASRRMPIVAEATVDGKPWAVRINDFPDEPLFTLIIAGVEVMHFDDWPEFWHRPELPEIG